MSSRQPAAVGDASGWSEVVVRQGFAELVSRRGSTVVRGGDAAVAWSQGRGDVEVLAAGAASPLERWGEDLDREAERSHRSTLYVEPELAYQAAALDRRVGGVGRDLVLVRIAFLRIRQVQAATLDVPLPAVVDAAQAAFLVAAPEQARDVRLVHEVVETEREGDAHLDRVAIAPGAREREVRPRRRVDGFVAAVDFHEHTAGGPRRHANLQVEPSASFN